MGGSFISEKDNKILSKTLKNAELKQQKMNEKEDLIADGQSFSSSATESDKDDDCDLSDISNI